MLKKDLYDLRYAIVIIIIILYLVIMQTVFGTLCPFYALTHFPCPGCGLTRGSIQLLKGNIVGALEFNKTVILWDLTILLFLIDRYIKPIKIKPFPVLFIIVSLITLIIYIIEQTTKFQGFLG